MTESNIRAVTILLEVFDMPMSVAFYRALGGEVVRHWGDREGEWDWVVLKLGGAELMLNTAYERDQRPAALDPKRVEGHADAELFFDCVDVDAQCDVLRRIGLTDPDGFRVWFQAPIADVT